MIATGAISVRRSLNGSNDFDTFYNAGRAVLTGQGIYYTGDYYQAEERRAPFLYPPFAACLFSLFAFLPMGAASFLWNAFNIACLYGCFALMASILGIQAADLKHRWQALPKMDKALLAGMAGALSLDNLMMAQANIFIFFLTLLALMCWRKKRPFLSGFIFAFSIMIKLTPVLFLIFFAAKRSWRVLLGMGAGIVFLTGILPALFWGLENNRIYHRQWLGRTLKPIAAPILSIFKPGPEPAHPLQKSSSDLEHELLTSRLNEKNQALSATLTRLFLKNRREYGYGPAPIYVSRRYEALPVLFPIPQRVLFFGNHLLRLFFLAGLAALFSRKKDAPGAILPLELSLVYLSMPLLSPLARSHQFMVWLFAYMTLYLGNLPGAMPGWAILTARLAALFYFLQGLPYGKAAGMGTFADLTLCLGVIYALLAPKRVLAKGENIGSRS